MKCNGPGACPTTNVFFCCHGNSLVSILRSANMCSSAFCSSIGRLLGHFSSSGILSKARLNILQVSLPPTYPHFFFLFFSEEQQLPERVAGGGGDKGKAGSGEFLLRKSLWRFSVPSVSCVATLNWPRSWRELAGWGRASSAQSRSWQWSSWRKRRWRCQGSEALQTDRVKTNHIKSCFNNNKL